MSRRPTNKQTSFKRFCQTIVVLEENLVVSLEPGLHVVGVEDSSLGGGLQVLTHHLDVGPGNGKDGAGAPRSSRHGADGLGASNGHHRMAGEERGKVVLDSDGSHAWTAASVGNAEGLVQVQVADICTIVARAAEADLSVHIGAIEVHLASVLVNEGAGLLDALIEKAEGGRVGDHNAGELLTVLENLGLQVSGIEVATLITLKEERGSVRNSQKPKNEGRECTLTGTTVMLTMAAEAGLVP